MDCSPPGSSVHGILQARILEWVAIPFSRGSSQPSDGTWVSHTAGRLITAEPPGKNSWRKSVQDALWHCYQQYFFFALSPQAREKKKTTKNKQMGLFQILKNSFIVKGTINKTKSSPSEWEKIFANDISNKKILKIHKQHITQNQRNKNLVIPSTSKYSFLVVAFLQSKFAESNKKYSFFVSHSQNHGKTCVNNFDSVFSLYFFSGRIFPQTSNHSS